MSRSRHNSPQHTDPEVLSSGGVHLDPVDVPVAVGGPIPQDSGSDEDSGTASRSSMVTGGFINPSPNVLEEDLSEATQETTRQAELRTAEQFLRAQAYVRCLELIHSPDSPEGQRLRNIFGLDWIIFVLPALMKVRLQVTGDEQTDASQGLREHLEEEMRRKAESLEFINQLKEHELNCSCTAVDEGCILITLRAKDVPTLKKIIQRNERGTLSSYFEKILVSDKMRSVAAARGKKLSVKVSLENKDEIKEAVELLDNLAAPEKHEGQDLVDKMTLTYCPEEGKWYWTPDAIEGVWMEANIRTASRGVYVDIPLIEKLKKVLHWLQKRETFQSGRPQGPCYMCYLRHRKAAEETAVTGSL